MWALSKKRNFFPFTGGTLMQITLLQAIESTIRDLDKINLCE
jgi:hypothetical protein